MALYSLHDDLVFNQGISIYEVRHKRQSNGWLAVVKGYTSSSWLVAFVGGATYAGLLENLGRANEDSNLYWREDAYVPDWIQKQVTIPGS